MKYFLSHSGRELVAIDDQYFYYLDNFSEAYEDLSPIEHRALFKAGETAKVHVNAFKEEQGGWLKISVILSSLEEREYKFDLAKISTEIAGSSPKFQKLWKEHDEALKQLEQRVQLLFQEVSGPASHHECILYLESSGDSYILTSANTPGLSPSEIIEYCGLTDSEYFETAIASGETITNEIGGIETAVELKAAILNILTDGESWGISEGKIDWASIIHALVSNSNTNKIGIDLDKLIKK